MRGDTHLQVQFDGDGALEEVGLVRAPAAPAKDKIGVSFERERGVHQEANHERDGGGERRSRRARRFPSLPPFAPAPQQPDDTGAIIVSSRGVSESRARPARRARRPTTSADSAVAPCLPHPPPPLRSSTTHPGAATRSANIANASGGSAQRASSRGAAAGSGSIKNSDTATSPEGASSSAARAASSADGAPDDAPPLSPAVSQRTRASRASNVTAAWFEAFCARRPARRWFVVTPEGTTTAVATPLAKQAETNEKGPHTERPHDHAQLYGEKRKPYHDEKSKNSTTRHTPARAHAA